MELTHHYADVRPVETYAGRRVFIVGKQNSGFELATGLLPWARQIVLASPSQARLSVDTRSLVGVRARYVQPFEDLVLGGGVSVLDAAIDRIERAAGGGLVVHLRRTDGGADLVIEVDDVIAATGFVTPLVDLPGAGRRHVRGEPAARPDAVVGERQRARASSSPARSGRGPRACASTASRPTRAPSTGRATTPACWPATWRGPGSGSSRSGRSSRPDAVAAFLATELAESPELFHQRGYLARVLTADGSGGLRDDGIQPLAHVLDADGPDAIVASLEADGTGAIYPVVYSRIGGKVVERVIDPDPLLRYDTSDTRLAIADLQPGGLG